MTITSKVIGTMAAAGCLKVKSDACKVPIKYKSSFVEKVCANVYLLTNAVITGMITGVVSDVIIMMMKKDKKNEVETATTQESENQNGE